MLTYTDDHTEVISSVNVDSTSSISSGSISVPSDVVPNSPGLLIVQCLAGNIQDPKYKSEVVADSVKVLYKKVETSSQDNNVLVVSATFDPANARPGNEVTEMLISSRVRISGLGRRARVCMGG